MKEFSGRFLAQLHWIILAYAAWGAWGLFGEHTKRVEEIRAQAPEIETAIGAARTRLKAIAEYRNNIQSSRRNVEEVFRSIEEVQQKLPTEVTDLEMLEFFSRESRQLNIPGLEATPMAEVTQGFYHTKPYELRGQGTFLQFVIFLERLADAKRLFSVQSVTLGSAPEGSRGRFQLVSLKAVVETFAYNTAYKESSGLEEIDAQFKDGGGSAGGGRRRRKKKPIAVEGGGE
jgi:Tfp pilus assembly protein PilO